MSSQHVTTTRGYIKLRSAFLFVYFNTCISSTEVGPD